MIKEKNINVLNDSHHPIKIKEMEKDIFHLKEINKELAQVDSDQLLLSKNNLALKHLESELIALKEIMETMSYLVVEQGIIVEKIDQNVISAKENTDESVSNIKKATQYEKHYNKQVIKTIAVTALGGALGGGIGSVFGIIPAVLGGSIGSFSGLFFSFIKKY